MRTYITIIISIIKYDVIDINIPVSAVILSTILLLTCSIIVIYSYICGKSLYATHQLSPSDYQPNWCMVNKLFVTQLCILFYFLFQFILSLNCILIRSDYKQLTDSIALYLLTDTALLFGKCLIFKQNVSAFPEYENETNTMHAGLVQTVFHRATSGENISYPQEQLTEQIRNNGSDNEWNEYLKIEQYNLMQNIPYLKSIYDAIPAIDSNNIHLQEMRLILTLKLWIEHYGVPSMMNGNNINNNCVNPRQSVQLLTNYTDFDFFANASMKAHNNEAASNECSISNFGCNYNCRRGINFILLCGQKLCPFGFERRNSINNDNRFLKKSKSKSQVITTLATTTKL